MWLFSRVFQDLNKKRVKFKYFKHFTHLVRTLERAKSKCFAWVSVDIARKMGLDQETYIPTVPLTVTHPWLFLSVVVDLYLLENSHLFKDTGNLPV